MEYYSDTNHDESLQYLNRIKDLMDIDTIKETPVKSKENNEEPPSNKKTIFEEAFKEDYFDNIQENTTEITLNNGTNIKDNEDADNPSNPKKPL